MKRFETVTDTPAAPERRNLPMTGLDSRANPPYHKGANLDNFSSQRLAVSIDEAAHLLSISRPVAYDLTKRSDFPSFRIGKRVLVNVRALQDWLDEQVATAQGGYDV